MSNYSPTDYNLLELDKGHPLAPDWLTICWQNFGGTPKSMGRNPLYRSNGAMGGSDFTTDGQGWRFVNTASADAAVVSRITFDEVGKRVDGSFTMGAFLTPEQGTEVNAFVMSIGKTTSQDPAVGLGYYGSLGRVRTAWDGTSVHTGSNNDIVWGERYFAALRYDAVADTLQVRWVNLETGVVKEHNQTGKTWPTSIQATLSLGGHHRSTVYYDPMEGTLERAMYWDRTLTDDELFYVAFNKDSFLVPVMPWAPAAAASGPTGTSAKTLDAFVSSGSGTTTIQGTSAKTLDAFVSSGSGTTTIQGTSAKTLDAFVSSASGTTTIQGTVAKTLDVFASSASGTTKIEGSSAKTLDAFVSAGSGTAGNTITGTVAKTLDNFVSAASGTTTLQGSSAVTLDAFVSAATGNLTHSGTVAVTLDSFTSSGAGTTTINGTAANTLNVFVSSATGFLPTTGTSASTLDAFTSSGTGTAGIKTAVDMRTTSIAISNPLPKVTVSKMGYTIRFTGD